MQRTSMHDEDITLAWMNVNDVIGTAVDLLAMGVEGALDDVWQTDSFASTTTQDNLYDQINDRVQEAKNLLYDAGQAIHEWINAPGVGIDRSEWPSG